MDKHDDVFKPPRRRHLAHGVDDCSVLLEIAARRAEDRTLVANLRANDNGNAFASRLGGCTVVTRNRVGIAAERSLSGHEADNLTMLVCEIPVRRSRACRLQPGKADPGSSDNVHRQSVVRSRSKLDSRRQPEGDRVGDVCVCARAASGWVGGWVGG